jgi:hypothetical protein
VALRELAADILRRVRWVLRCFAVEEALLQPMKTSIGFLLHQTHYWVRSSPLRVVGPQESVEEAFGLTVLGLHWVVVVVRQAVFVGLAGLVEVVAAAHSEGEHSAWTASVACYSAVHCSVAASELVIPSPSSRSGAPHPGD